MRGRLGHVISLRVLKKIHISFIYRNIYAEAIVHEQKVTPNGRLGVLHTSLINGKANKMVIVSRREI